MIDSNPYIVLLQELRKAQVLKDDLSQHGRSSSNLEKIHELYTAVLDVTSFIEYDIDTKGRLSILQMGLTFQPKCKVCRALVKIRTTGKLARTYPTFCPGGCSNKSEGVKNKKTQSTLERYGVKNISQSEIIKNLKQTTNIKKRGVKCSLSDPDVRDKIKKTCLERYGGPAPVCSEYIKNKKRNTCLERYSTPYAAQKDHSPQSLLKLHDKTWLNDQYYNLNIPIWKIGENLNVCARTVTNYFLKHGIIPKKEFSTSHGERELNHWITSCLDLYTESNTRKIITPKELDIFIPEFNLAVEYNGIYFHTTEYIDNDYHVTKTSMAENMDIDLIHIFDVEWKFKPGVVKGLIAKKTNRSHVIDDDYQVCVIDELTANNFYKTNSFDSVYGTSDTNLCLLWNGLAVFVCSFCIETQTIENYAEITNQRHINADVVVSEFLKQIYGVDCFYILHQRRLGKNITWKNVEFVTHTPTGQLYPGVWDCGFDVVLNEHR